ncbi:MAG: lipoate--protein ligase family protein [Candidatus Omnitrophota bacterium]
MGKQWRLIIEDKKDGYYNMAVDEALFFGYSVHKIPTLRIYGWDKPFISLGYNQNPAKALNFPIKIPIVRRMTGGSAILHDKEITYSIVCGPRDLELAGSVKESYRRICFFLKIFYLKLGLRAEFARDISEVKKNLLPASSLCFADCQRFDLVINSKKIGGNAQRRRRNNIFQHGSIPQKIDFSLLSNLAFNREDVSSRAAGLNDLLKQEVDFYQLQTILAESFREAFGVQLFPEKLSGKEKEITGIFLSHKYTSSNWNYKRIFNAPSGILG